MEDESMEKEELAVELKHSGHNCCQSVLEVFTEEAGVDEELLERIGIAFGGGMGGNEGTCGALCGAELMLGMILYEGKKMHSDASDIYEKFRNTCGSAICKELKGNDTGTPLYTCDDCIRVAVKLVQEKIAEKKNG